MQCCRILCSIDMMICGRRFNCENRQQPPSNPNKMLTHYSIIPIHCSPSFPRRAIRQHWISAISIGNV